MSDNSQSIFFSEDRMMSDIQYKRPMGAYKPHFQGMPEDYFPATKCEVATAALIVLFIVGGMLGVMIGFLFWQMRTGTEIYIDVWVAINLFVIVLLLFLIWYGGLVKRREQKVLFQKKLQEEKDALERERKMAADKRAAGH